MSLKQFSLLRSTSDGWDEIVNGPFPVATEIKHEGFDQI